MGTQQKSSLWTIAGLALAMSLSTLSISIANVALPTLAQAFDVPFQHVQWVVLAYLLSITTMIVTAGKLGDNIGRRRLLLGGLALYTVAAAFCAAAPTFWLLVAARAVQGLGAAAMMAMTLSLVGETVPKEKTGSAMGVLGAMSAIGTAIGPTLGGLLIDAFTWRAIFMISIPLGALALYLAHRSLPNGQDGQNVRPPGFDVSGMLLLGLALMAYSLSMTMGRGNFGLFNLALLGAAALGAGFFTLAEKRALTPLINLSLFTNPVLTLGFIMNALVSTVLMATLVVGPFYLANALSLEAAMVGLVMSVGPAVAALTGVPAGRIVDRFGVRSTTVIGLVGIAAGCLLLSLLPDSLGVIGYAIPVALVTANYALFQTANNTGVMADVPHNQRGVISGMLNLSRNLGLITGASAMGAVFTKASGSFDISRANPEAIVTGMHTTFAVGAVMMAVALTIALASRFLLGEGVTQNSL